MSRGLLFIGGAGPSCEFLENFVQPDDVICAADSGLDAALAAGVRPHGVVGDMDSISDPVLLDDFPPECIDVYPQDKEETDAELGIAWLRERGCQPLVLIGGGEGRLDHTLALKALFASVRPPDFWYTALEEIRLIEGDMELPGPPGSLISFFPAGLGPWRISSQGLKWELGSLDWTAGTVSLSNRINGENTRITVEAGRFLVVRPIGFTVPQSLSTFKKSPY